MAALRSYTSACGNWKLMGQDARLANYSSMHNVMKGDERRLRSLWPIQVSRLAAVPFDDVVTGRYPVKGMCPHCGHASSDA